MDSIQKACIVPHPPLIVPGVGNGSEIPNTRKAYELIALDIEEYAPDTAVIISPHSVMYSDYIHISPGTGAEGDFANFNAADIEFSVRYDEELAACIAELAAAEGISAGTEGERNPALDHGTMVPLYFFKALEGKPIVRIGLSGLSLIEHYRFGMVVARAISQLGRRAYIVASGDMSHKLERNGPYGFSPDGPAHDMFVRECLESSDFRRLMSVDTAMCERAAECGFRSIVITAGAMDGFEVSTKVLSYEGPFGVGYLTAEITGKGKAQSLLLQLIRDREAHLDNIRKNEDEYVCLARSNIEKYICSGKPLTVPDDLPSEMTERRAGVFVSVHKHGQLRGCIGTILPTCDNIALEIIQNGISAAVHDPRFPSIEEGELPELDYSVDILASPEPIDSPLELDTERYGVIVSHKGKRGLLLPNLDGVDTVEKQIDIARNKGGIGKDDPYTLERFEVVRHT